MGKEQKEKFLEIIYIIVFVLLFVQIFSIFTNVVYLGSINSAVAPRMEYSIFLKWSCAVSGFSIVILCIFQVLNLFFNDKFKWLEIALGITCLVFLIILLILNITNQNRINLTTGNSTSLIAMVSTFMSAISMVTLSLLTKIALIFVKKTKNKGGISDEQN